MTTPEIDSRISEAVKGSPATSDDLVRIILTGETSVDAEKDIEHVKRQVSERFFYGEVKDSAESPSIMTNTFTKHP